MSIDTKAPPAGGGDDLPTECRYVKYQYVAVCIGKRKRPTTTDWRGALSLQVSPITHLRRSRVYHRRCCVYVHFAAL